MIFQYTIDKYFKILYNFNNYVNILHLYMERRIYKNEQDLQGISWWKTQSSDIKL